MSIGVCREGDELTCWNDSDHGGSLGDLESIGETFIRNRER